jgi:acetoin utilization deacetylase AcuC-like enzyme
VLFASCSGCPLTAGSWVAARAGAACALAAAQAVAAGERSAFAPTRPPGYHAGPDCFGGYCLLNNAAVAAQALRDTDKQRVAVIDIDCHHRNGTQSIFYERADLLTVSIRGDPHTEYPCFSGHANGLGEGAGMGFNLNLPLPRGSGFVAWRGARDNALQVWPTNLAPRRQWCLWIWTPSRANPSRLHIAARRRHRHRCRSRQRRPAHNVHL